MVGSTEFSAVEGSGSTNLTNISIKGKVSVSNKDNHSFMAELSLDEQPKP